MSLLVNRYNYTTLSRQNKNGVRHYVLPNYNLVGSVTTILEKTMPPEKRKMLDEWAKRVGTEQANHIKNTAADRGTRMHTHLENYVLNGVADPRPSLPKSIESWLMANVIIENGLQNVDEIWGSEISLYYPDLYAGTTDLVGVYQGQPAIMDFKQSNKVKTVDRVTDYFLQLTAYALAHNFLYGTNIKTGVIFMAVKPEQAQKPQYLQFILSGDDFDKYSIEWANRVSQYYGGS